LSTHRFQYVLNNDEAQYRGGVEYPLDASPVFRYTAKDSLNAPQVTAVEQFRKAIEESEKQSLHKP
jgi:hypothetical protein